MFKLESVRDFSRPNVFHPSLPRKAFVKNVGAGLYAILAFSSLPLFPEGEMWRNAGLYVHSPQIFANVENFGAMTSNGFAGKIWSGGEKIATQDLRAEKFVEKWRTDPCFATFCGDGKNWSG